MDLEEAISLRAYLHKMPPLRVTVMREAGPALRLFPCDKERENLADFMHVSVFRAVTQLLPPTMVRLEFNVTSAGDFTCGR